MTNRKYCRQVQYRMKFTKPMGRNAMPLLRIGWEKKIYGHEQRWVYTTENMFTGSVFNLSWILTMNANWS